MSNRIFLRWGRITAVLSLIIWFVLTPFMATIWAYDNGRLIWERKPLLVRTIGHWLAEQGAFAFAAEEVVYFSYGRYFCLVYLLLIPTLMAFHRRYENEDKRFQQRCKILLYSLLIAGIGDFISYGLGIFSPFLWRAGFGLEMIALLSIFMASLLYGRSLLQQPTIPRWLGWLLIIAAILVPPMLFERFLTGYWPNSPVLPLVLAWAVIGFHLWRRRGETAVLGGLIWAGFHIWLIQSGRLNDPLNMMGSLGILILPLLGFMMACYAFSFGWEWAHRAAGDDRWAGIDVVRRHRHISVADWRGVAGGHFGRVGHFGGVGLVCYCQSE